MIRNNKLDIFGPNHTVVMDMNLLKFENSESHRRSEILHEPTGITIPISNINSSTPEIWLNSNITQNSTEKKSWKEAILTFFSKTKKEEAFREDTVDIIEVFNNVKGSIENLELYENKANAYTALIRKAKSAGQVAFVEKLARNAIVYQYECILYAAGFTKFIPEDKLVEACRKSERGLNLTYIKNYIRYIPDDIMDLREKADELRVFDNFVILHYDPENKDVEQTHEEKVEEDRKRKDPILFGLIQGSDKLYFIGDWIDEVCDLTWDKLAEMVYLKDEITASPNV